MIAQATKDASTPKAYHLTNIFKAVSERFGYDYDPETGEIRGVLKPEQTAEVARLRAKAIGEFKRSGGDMEAVAKDTRLMISLSSALLDAMKQPKRTNCDAR